MLIKSTLNGGLAEVDPEYAERLIADGSWESAEKPARKKPGPKPKSKPAPTQEPSTQE
ncbi:head-tail connector protein [Mycobacterium phage Anthony]|uniref:Head-to-tail connector protein n=1 Tax=Mycobacterium phage Anthony TaxID=2599857 RepID=A0A5J6TJ19_9CAUD|nr:head-tail connector protein [Mycobacterium phage Anthony]QFG10388.1 hypothetical protein PBI_ANTHONY_16 [Mycobacterium phage Anthony]